MQRLIRGRINKLGICVVLLLSMLVGRLVQLQLISTESFTKDHINLIEASVRQRTQALVVDEGRGRFIDRNGEPLTHDYFPSVVLFPFLNGLDWPKEEVAAILGISGTEIDRLLEKAEKPVILNESLTESKMEKINELDYPGIVALYRQFKLQDQIAQHVVGYTSEDYQEFLKRYPDKVSKENYSPHTPIGAAGLEEAFDEIILPEGTTQLLYHVDRFGGPLFGIDVRYMAPSNPYYPVSVKTTIDKEIQKLAEEVLENHSVDKGGIVVMDISSNEVLAMASKPSVDKVNPSAGAGALNLMLEPHFPGSVFKTVVTAAALEENIIDEKMTFDCDRKINGELEEEGSRKGELDLEASFSQSCNNTFGELGKMLASEDAEALERYAEILGLSGTVGWQGDMFGFHDFQQIPKEKSSVIWDGDEDKRVPLAVAQTSIGQKDVKVTPLSVANMMATIARGGTSMEVKLVKEILYKNGTPLYTFPEHKRDVEKLSSFTVMQLQHLLREVVAAEHGTGRLMQGLPYQVAGKSGTAQTGKFVNGDSTQGEYYNRWFAGYFPIQSPSYAMVVVNLDVLEDDYVNTPIYIDMVKGLYDLDMQ